MASHGLTHSMETRSAAVGLYVSGMTMEGACRAVGLPAKSRTWLDMVLNQYGIRKHPRPSWSYPRRYEINERYFHIIDSPAKAYWLGFICADGSIVTRKGRPSHLGIGLQLADKRHLEKFRDALGSTAPVTVRRIRSSPHGRVIHRWMCNYSVSSKQMLMDLIRRGVTPHKTKRISIPRGIPRKYIRDFWRGVIDGDGTVRKTPILTDGIRYEYWGVHLYGSWNMVRQFCSYARSICETRARPHQNRGIFATSIIGHQAPILLRELYRGASIALERKLIVARRAMNSLGARKKPKRGCLGYRHTPDAIRRMSEAKREYWADPKHREKASRWRKRYWRRFRKERQSLRRTGG